jgi:predicted dehydrogenase
MAKKTLGIGIIGSGWAADGHVDNLKQIEGCEVVAICSRKKARAAEFAAGRGLSDATAYGKLDAFLKHDGLDIVSICTTHPQHPAQTIAAARAGKHIIIEKPVALNRADLRQMVAAVKAARVKTSVCVELRWVGLFKTVKALLDQGLIGNVFYGEASYYHGIGPWYGQYGWNIKKRIGVSAELTAGIHALDSLIWLMDSKVVEVSAMTSYSKGNALNYEYAPNSVAIMKFANGAIGKVATSVECRQPYHFPVVLQGDKGTIRDDLVSTTEWPGLLKDQWAKLPADMPDSGDVHDHPYLGQFQHFIDCIRTNRRPHNDLANCAHVHEVCFAIQQAVRTRKAVKVPKTPGT